MHLENLLIKFDCLMAFWNRLKEILGLSGENSEKKEPVSQADLRGSGKDSAKESDSAVVEREMELVQKVLLQMENEEVKPFLRIEITDAPVSFLGSKVGGTPYLPSDASVPCDSEGNPLRLLAQIDCRDLVALPDFPHTGLLQFWIGQDDSNGLFDDEGHRVIWHETIDEQVTEESVLAKLAAFPPAEEDYFPVIEEFSISFKENREPRSFGDVRFNQIFTSKYNAISENPIEHIYDLSDDAYELIDESVKGGGHKIGGYPAFAQEDPREEEDERTVLLLQLDSEEPYIMWGDCGLCGFFCSPEDLRRCDFSNVLYNWDCY